MPLSLGNSPGLAHKCLDINSVLTTLCTGWRLGNYGRRAIEGEAETHLFAAKCFTLTEENVKEVEGEEGEEEEEGKEETINGGDKAGGSGEGE